jgi:hypothetical protein
MMYGTELIKKLEAEIETLQGAMNRRAERIANWETDDDDCFISERVESRGIQVNREKIALIKDGGCAWFPEYATLDGKLVKAHWCNTKYGYSLRVEMPDGKVVWTTSNTAKGLAKRGLKRVECLRPAWFAYSSPYGGMMGVYCGSYELFPSNYNYATGEDAKSEPIEIRDAE